MTPAGVCTFGMNAGFAGTRAGIFTEKLSLVIVTQDGGHWPCAEKEADGRPACVSAPVIPSVADNASSSANRSGFVVRDGVIFMARIPFNV
jgi:hypothetical protein